MHPYLPILGHPYLPKMVHICLPVTDGNLRLLQEEIALERRLVPNQKGESIAFHKDHRTKLLCHWLSGLEYKTHMLNWVECNEEVSVKNQGVIKGQRFVHITNMELKIGRASCRERV